MAETYSRTPGTRATYALLEVDPSGTVVRCSANLITLFGGKPGAACFEPGMSMRAVGEILRDWTTGRFVDSMAEDMEAPEEQRSRDIVLYDGTILDCTYIRHGSPADRPVNSDTTDRVEAGEVRDDSVHRDYFTDEAGRVWADSDAHNVWIFRDVTNDRIEQDRLRFQSEVLARVSDAVMTVDASMAISYWNRGAEVLTGFPAEAALGKGPEELFAFRFATLEEEHAAWAAIGDSGHWNGELIIRTANSDRDRFVSTSASVLYDDDGEFGGLLAVVRDETERKEMEDKLLHHASHDPLTDLPNRVMLLRTIDAVLDESREGGPPYAVLFLDLDRFKMVNDSLGHHAGDALLKALAIRLVDCTRASDMVARLGGDEFAVLLKNTGEPGGAREAAVRLMNAFATPFIVEGMEVFSSASIGIAMGEERYETAEELLRDADTAMYQAKRAGRSCVAVFDQNLRVRATAMFRIESDLRHAIERDELRVFYQPIVRLRERTLHGFEALIRWEHATRGLIGPEEFIRAAEESDLIVDLDRWVWSEVVRQIAAWRDRFGAEVDLMFSVNCADRSLRRADLPQFVGGLLSNEGVSPATFGIEVTEQVVIDDTGPAATALAGLREMGIQLALDDFGTGHASLSVLHALPVNLLKIDRSFVNRMDRSADGTEMVRTVLELGKSLGLECVAEGIETRRQVEQLQRMGCAFGQGHLFSRAMDASMAADLITNRRAWLRQTWPDSGQEADAVSASGDGASGREPLGTNIA